MPQRREHRLVEAFVAQPAIEAFNESVLGQWAFILSSALATSPSVTRDRVPLREPQRFQRPQTQYDSRSQLYQWTAHLTNERPTSSYEKQI
jgi:hypothetical protein